MFAVIRGIGALIVLVAAVWGGYRWGGWEVDRLKADLESIRKTGEAAQQASEQAQAAIKAEMTKLGQAHDEKVGQINQQFEAERQTLKGQLSRTEDQRSALSRQRQTLESDLEDIRKALSANPAITEVDRQRLQSLKSSEENLLVSIQQNERQQAGLKCLQMPVPAEQVATLNRGLSAPKEH